MLIKFLFAFGLGAYSIWHLYFSLVFLIGRLPVSSILSFTAAVAGFVASYFSWAQDWWRVLLYFVVSFVVGDLAAVFWDKW